MNTHHPHSCTGQPSVLDLALGTPCIRAGALDVFQELTSDHYPIIRTIQITIDHGPYHLMHYYKLANLHSYKSVLDEHLDLQTKAKSLLEIDKHVAHLTDAIYIAATLHITSAMSIPKGKAPANLHMSYHPVSLAILSKVAECIVLARLEAEVARQQPLPYFQFGFWRHLSTQHALAYATHIITHNFTRHNRTRMALPDLSCAFDKVHHHTLLFKLAFLRFNPALIFILHSFREARTLWMRVEGYTSRPRAITAGMPQGSTLSPLLFSLYTHGIPTPTECTVVMYVDDTVIHAHNKDLHMLSAQLTVAIRAITTYFQAWGIPLNANKIQTIIFTRHHAKLTPLMAVQGSIIKYKYPVKYLDGALYRSARLMPHFASAMVQAYCTFYYFSPILCHQSYLQEYDRALLFKTYMTYPSVRISQICKCPHHPTPSNNSLIQQTSPCHSGPLQSNEFRYNTAPLCTLISTYPTRFFTKARQQTLPIVQQIGIHDMPDTYPHRLLIDFTGYRPP
ncbi:hypothetical protein PR048_010792 [Dryococelus australis]|uniref:Reverse transcriptase domain-containing protein n=1 Tax=Dryococelus australis TaxID=614101 RepID=A0ABQ9I4I6_9NEOP|nr:hypothetical protein PR048_010792 [Dryococelus australis]